jgi:DNA topoisomerase-1
VQLGEDEQKGKPKRVSLPRGVIAEEVDLQTALDLLALPRVLGEHPETEKPIVANIGRYGPYVQHERTFASLKAEDDVLSVDLDRALALLSEKTAKAAPLKTLGAHPVTGEMIEIWKGRFGPYVKHQKTNASLPKKTSPEEISLEAALKLLEAKEKPGKKGAKGRKGSTRKKGSK